jgi:hypothetical protein
MEGTSSADVLNKQYNVIHTVSMTCLEGILSCIAGFRSTHHTKCSAYKGPAPLSASFPLSGLAAIRCLQRSAKAKALYKI